MYSIRSDEVFPSNNIEPSIRSIPLLEGNKNPGWRQTSLLILLGKLEVRAKMYVGLTLAFSISGFCGSGDLM